jgi:Domain of unknown function (DUF4386)
MSHKNPKTIYMEQLNAARKKTARITGLLYFIFALIAIYDYMYVSPEIFVNGDMAATMKNMVAGEFLLRTTFIGSIISNILFAVVALLLYRLLKPVNDFYAKWMVVLVLVAIPPAFVTDAACITVLKISKGDLLQGFSPEQAQGIAATILKVRSYTHQLTTFHWGLWLIPLAVLVYQSGFIPRILGILLFINGLGYMISSTTFILFPAYITTVSKFVYPTWFAGEVPFILWLMIAGVKNNKRAME